MDFVRLKVVHVYYTITTTVVSGLAGSTLKTNLKLDMLYSHT